MGIWNYVRCKMDNYLHSDGPIKKTKTSFISDKYPTKRDVLGKSTYTYV